MKLCGIDFHNVSNVPFSKVSFGAKIKSTEFDTVSFTNKEEKNEVSKKHIPIRLQSKMQDSFHSTSRQVMIRSLLELKEKGLTDEEIAKVWYKAEYENDKTEVKKEHLEAIEITKKLLKETDDAFSCVVPSMLPKTYYRGVLIDKTSRVAEIIKKAEIKDVIQPDLGYSFLASKKSYAESYADYASGKPDPTTCIVMKIKTPIGTPISRDITFAPLEGNVVLARGAKFEVLDKEIKDGKTYITLKYLSCAKDEKKSDKL